MTHELGFEIKELVNTVAIQSRRVHSAFCVSSWCDLPEAGDCHESLERYLKQLYGCDPELFDPGFESGILLEDKFGCQYKRSVNP